MQVEDSAIDVLRRAAETKEVDRQIVVESIRTLATKKNPTIDPEAIRGKWELIFSSIPGGAANGFLVGGFFNGYFAIKEVVDFYAFSLDTSVGGFIGPSQVASTSPLVIEYEYKKFIPLNIGPLGQEVPPNVRSYTFIYVDDGLAVARIDTGGATLLRKVR